MAEEDLPHRYAPHHIIFVWFLSLLPLLDWDLFRDQTVCGHHHVIICKSEEQRERENETLVI